MNVVLGIDPGTRKCGYAVIEEIGRPVLAQGIVDTNGLSARLAELAAQFPVRVVALGGGTHADAVAALVRAAGLPLVVVDERETTLQARGRYFRAHPPRGWKRLVPRGLLLPPCPIDDFAALLIAERYVEQERRTSLTFPAVLFCAVFVFCSVSSVRAASDAPIVFVPLDDRPVTLQLPVMLGEIAGRRVLTPPPQDLGSYLLPGNPEAILRWAGLPATQDANAMIVSADMIAYGGLVASRTPEVTEETALLRLGKLAELRRERPDASLDVFGTIMRLAPTGLPRLPVTEGYWAVDGTVDALQTYANLHDPPIGAREEKEARRLREKIGRSTLNAYLASRVRNLDADLFLLQCAADGGIDRLVLGQDDAGPVGLHVRDVAALNERKGLLGLDARASIEPGADELGMVLLAAAFARDVSWKPTVSVRYSRSGAEELNDPLEFVPIDATLSHLIAIAGATRVAGAADVELFVKVPDTTEHDEGAFLDGITEAIRRHGSVAVADLSFLNDPNPSKEQRQLTEELVARGSAGLIDAFSSWNTTANTAGTALAEAIAAGAGKRARRYNALAHARFMLDRYIDDYAFRQFVRPMLNATLRAGGIDPTLLPASVAQSASRENSDALRRYGRRLAAVIYPQYRESGMTITLPWQRTFETRIDLELNDPLEKYAAPGKSGRGV